MKLILWIVVALIGLFFGIRGYIEYVNIKVREENITIQGVSDIKIVFLSDIQYDNSLYYLKKQLNKLISMVNQHKPDLVIIGGDIIHSKNKYNAFIFEALNKIESSEIIAVLGNHDYLNIDEVLEYYKQSRIKLLINESYTYQNLSIYGVDDLREGNPKIDNRKYNLLISHNPDFFEFVPEGFSELGIAGHFHGGQIVLCGYAPAIVSKNGQKYRYGWVSVNGMRTFVSSGLGGWLFYLPLRYKAPPEIIVWNIKKSYQIR